MWKEKVIHFIVLCLFICFVSEFKSATNAAMTYKDAVEYSKLLDCELRPGNLTVRDEKNHAYDEKVIYIFGKLGEIKHIMKDSMTQFIPLFNFGHKAKHDAVYQITWLIGVDETLLGQLSPVAIDIHFVNGQIYPLPIREFIHGTKQGVNWSRIHTFSGEIILKKQEVFELSKLGDVDFVLLRDRNLSGLNRTMVYRTDKKQLGKLTRSFQHGLKILQISET